MQYEIVEGGAVEGNVEAFVRLVEGYYGRYAEPILRREIKEWIVEEHLDSSLFRAWYKRLVRSVSREYNNQPDIVQLSKVYRDVAAARAAERSAVPALDVAPVMSRDEAAAAMKKLLADVVEARSFRGGDN